MAVCAYKGTENLVKALDEAIAHQTTEAAVSRVKDCLVRVISQGEVELPDEVCVPCEDRYARRLIHRSDDFNYEVIAMIWGPGQGTPLHDHAGIWCVEGVYQGEIVVCQYDLVRREGERFLFRTCDSIHAQLGMAGSLIPPYEYHTISNGLPDESSITLHVYGGKMEFCHTFEPLGQAWFRRVRKTLTYSG